jgi:hypothetical protein
MLEPREFSTPEHKRYAAECRRLAAIAQPLVKAVPRKSTTVRRKPVHTDWLGAVVNQFRKPSRRERKLIPTWAR